MTYLQAQVVGSDYVGLLVLFAYFSVKEVDIIIYKIHTAVYVNSLLNHVIVLLYQQIFLNFLTYIFHFGCVFFFCFLIIQVR